MSPCRKRIIESAEAREGVDGGKGRRGRGRGEVDVGSRQMKRDGLRRLEMQYSPANPVTMGHAK
jgi:hypothetical protein